MKYAQILHISSRNIIVKGLKNSGILKIRPRVRSIKAII